MQLTLQTIKNEECYNEFDRISETGFVNRKGKVIKKAITQQIKNSLYDGITDQVLCTKITCDGEDPKGSLR